MRKLIGVLCVVSLLAGCASTQEPRPPSAVTVEVAVEVPCRIPEPQCSVPAFDRATKGQEGDVLLRLLRAEAVEQEDCLRRYREALAACRVLPEAPRP